MPQPLTTPTTARTAWPPVAPPPAPKYPLVMVITGGYQVDLGPSSLRRSPRFHLVLKDRTCNCGATDCLGMRSVEAHLKAGGMRAPDGSALKSLTGPCPICNGATRAVGGRWECLDDKSHYWLYRVTRLQAACEKYLNGLSPKARAYREDIATAFASNEVREVFVQAHRTTYNVNA